jgi:cytidylate kinase
MKRVLVIGTSGSGKSTLAQHISGCLGVPFFASDHFYWETGWNSATPDKVRQQVLGVVQRETWVLDGNFDNLRELVWKQADCIIWLDYSLLTIGTRIISRNLRWVLTGQPTWSGNRMSLPHAVSGIRHAFKSYALKRQNFPVWLAELPGTTIQHFHTSRETEAWLQSLKSTGERDDF